MQPKQTLAASAALAAAFFSTGCEERYQPQPSASGGKTASPIVSAPAGGLSTSTDALRTSQVSALNGDVTGTFDYFASHIDLTLTFNRPGSFAVVALDHSRFDMSQVDSWSFVILKAGEQHRIQNMPTTPFYQFIGQNENGSLRVEFGKLTPK
jgi:hypothetical protein